MAQGRRTWLRVCLTCAVVLLLPAGWNSATAAWNRIRYPAPGTFHIVDGGRMHLYCVGSGSPTVVLEGGADGDWLDRQGVQPLLAGSARVCTYDRFGLGWSDVRAGKRDAETIARQLQALLNAARVSRPLILTGFSAGGLYVREYARQFPHEVAGMMLVDASHPAQVEELPGFRASYEESRRTMVREVRWETLRVWSGWARLTGKCAANPPPAMRAWKAHREAMKCRPDYVGANAGTIMDFGEAARQAGRLRTLGNVPLAVLSQDSNRQLSPTGAEAAAELWVWDREQEELKNLSSRSWRVIARGSGHAIHVDRSDVFLGEMRRLLQVVSGGSTEMPFGATVTR